MCFKKSSSSTSSAQTSTQRDERIAAEGGSNVLSVKDEGTAEFTIINNDLSSEIVREALGYSESAFSDAAALSEGTITRSLNAVTDVTQDALSLARVAGADALNAVTDATEDAFGFVRDANGRTIDAVRENSEDAYNFAANIFGAALDTVEENNQRSSQFVSATQAQFADARETDVKQVFEQLVKLAAITAAGVVAYKVLA